LENKINESSSKFNLSKVNLANIRPENQNFIFDDDELTGLVEEIQKIRKEVIEILLDIRKNIDLTKLTNKYSSGRGIYQF
jgi:copper homeostasis protein CutC